MTLGQTLLQFYRDHRGGIWDFDLAGLEPAYAGMDNIPSRIENKPKKQRKLLKSEGEGRNLNNVLEALEKRGQGQAPRPPQKLSDYIAYLLKNLYNIPLDLAKGGLAPYAIPTARRMYREANLSESTPFSTGTKVIAGLASGGFLAYETAKAALHSAHLLTSGDSNDWIPFAAAVLGYAMSSYVESHRQAYKQKNKPQKYPKSK